MLEPTATPAPTPDDDALVERVRSLLGAEGEVLGDRLDAAVRGLLLHADPRTVRVLRRRLVEGATPEGIARDGDAGSPGEVDRVVREAVRQVRADALRPSPPRRAPATPLEPLPVVRSPTPVRPEPAVGRDPQRPRSVNPPSLSTVEVVRRVRGPRRRWPVALGMVLLLLGAAAVFWWAPRNSSAELTRRGIELSRGALTAPQIEPMRHPAFPPSPPRGDLRAALAALKSAVDRDPTNAQAHLALAWLYVAHGMDADARFQVQEAETYGAPVAEVRFGRALIAWRTAQKAERPGDRDDSLREADDLLATLGPTDPGYRDAVYDRVRIALARGKPDRARQLAGAWREVSPGDPLHEELAALLPPEEPKKPAGGKRK